MTLYERWRTEFVGLFRVKLERREMRRAALLSYLSETRVGWGLPRRMQLLRNEQRCDAAKCCERHRLLCSGLFFVPYRTERV
jgi:hypothetical protein